MNSDSFVLCPRCQAKGVMYPLNQYEEDGRVVCGYCNGRWVDIEELWKEVDKFKEGK
jgi:Zn-finger nucleic acid-binding protein